jgi:hydrogenase maturation protease
MVSVLCIGIGNRYREDDAVGLHVADRLRMQNLPGVTVIEHNGEGASLLDAWHEAEAVILIDAVSSGAKPGTLFQVAAHDSPLPGRFFTYSTHAFGVAQALELARALDELPPSCIVFGIEGASFDFGLDVTPEVETTAEALVPLIVRKIEELCHAR